MTTTTSAEVGLFLEGLRCAGCVRRVEQSLGSAPGVAEASVNFSTQRAWVRFDPQLTGPDVLVARVVGLGYQAIPYDPAALDRPAQGEARSALVRLLVAAFLAANVMLVSIALYIGSYSDLDPVTRMGLRWLAIALSLPAVSWCAAPFWRGAWAGFRRREITMDVPVVLGASTAFGVSIAGTLAGAEHLYADSAAMIVFLILLGRTLESRARARASSAVEQLAALRPAKAWLRRGDGSVAPVDAARLVARDRVVVPVGEAVPADGVVVAGETEIDEALLSGESLPVVRRSGDRVTGGTRNLLGEIELEVSAALADGTLARMGALLERAAADKPRVQRQADRVASRFAPAVLAVAALTAMGCALSGVAPFEIALRAAAVLIVACPCALGLATPAAITAALGRAARLGILIKRGSALERCASVDLALLDKTGTLTQASFRVQALESAPDVAAVELVAAAAAAEGAATHPIADAIRREAERRLIPVEQLEPRIQRVGLGVEAGPAAARVLAGARDLLRDAGVSIAPSLEASAGKLAADGLTLVWVARGKTALGVIGVSDAPREDAREAVERLRAFGIDVELVSGDQPTAVRLAASAAGIGSAHAEQRPEDKLARVGRARAAGRCVLLAGDGINDAAALAAADVGVAMGRGAEVAVHAADVVIRAPRLGALPDLVDLARSSFRRIRENLAIALGYNALAVPLAVAGWLPPLHAAIAMSLSSLVVTGNAVRLLRWRPRR